MNCRRVTILFVSLSLFSLCPRMSYGYATGDRPSPRMVHRMVYGPVNERVLLFGGLEKLGHLPLNDLRVLDNVKGTWCKQDS
ncbi:MAG: hypothetical protein ACETVY_07065 [Candidatus Bathyarchaeia archaeon]